MLTDAKIDSDGMRVPRAMPLVRCSSPQCIGGHLIPRMACILAFLSAAGMASVNALFTPPLNYRSLVVLTDVCRALRWSMMQSSAPTPTLCVQMQGALLGFHKATPSQSRKDLPVCAAHLAASLEAAAAASGNAAHRIMM